MAYTRPLSQTFNQLNINMYRLPDGQRGALRSTSLALAREASKEDSHYSSGNEGRSSSHYNPFKGIKRLYSGFRKHKSSSARPEALEGDRLHKCYSTPASVGGERLSQSPPTARRFLTTSIDKRKSYSGAPESSAASAYPSPPKSPRGHKRVHFASSDPQVNETYSTDEYDRRVSDPWEGMNKGALKELREEMSIYSKQEMKLNDVYNSNDSKYCTLCWREHCYCRALSKDIWKRAKSTSMVHAGA